jgi:hypothetical protein
MSSSTKGVGDPPTESTGDLAEKPDTETPEGQRGEIGPPVAPRITKRGTSRAKTKIADAAGQEDPASPPPAASPEPQRAPKAKAQTGNVTKERAPRAKKQTTGQTAKRRAAEGKKPPAAKTSGQRRTTVKQPGTAKATRQRAPQTKGETAPKTTTRRAPRAKPQAVVEATAAAPPEATAAAPPEATAAAPPEATAAAPPEANAAAPPEVTAQAPETTTAAPPDLAPEAPPELGTEPAPAGIEEPRPQASEPLSARIARQPAVVLAALAGVLLLAAVVAAVALSGGSEDAFPTGAASIVPADTLAYINLSTDSSRPAVRQELALLERFPSYPLASAALLTRLASIVGGGKSVNFATDIKPWLGNEVAVAFLNTTSSAAGSLIALAVTDQSRARALLLRSGATSNGTYRGVQLYHYRTGTELAFVRNYLTLGQAASVRAAIDVSTGTSASLATNPAYLRASAGEPSDRVLDAYASAAGIQRILVSRGGALGGLGVLLYQPALDGAAISVTPAVGGAEVLVHSALNPSLKRLSGPPTPPFLPTLQNVAPSGSTLFLDTDGLDNAAPVVFKAAAAAGIGGQIGPLLHRLGDALAAEGVSPRTLVSLFSGETAVAVVPGRAGPAGNARPPGLIIVSRTKDEAQTKATLATMEVPLAQLFPTPSSGPGQAPEFNDVQIDGVTAHELSLTPGLQLDYAVFNGLVVVSTTRDGIAAVIAHQRAIAGDRRFRATLATRPRRVSSLLFLDFSQLLSLGEQTGLTPSARVRALTPDLGKIRGVGMDSTSGEADTTAELFLQIP